jgi:hypothetical protein
LAFFNWLLDNNYAAATAVDKEGRNALHRALWSGELEFVEGIRPYHPLYTSSVDANGQGILYYVVLSGSAEFVRKVLFESYFPSVDIYDECLRRPLYPQPTLAQVAMSMHQPEIAALVERCMHECSVREVMAAWPRSPYASISSFEPIVFRMYELGLDLRHCAPGDYRMAIRDATLLNACAVGNGSLLCWLLSVPHLGACLQGPAPLPFVHATICGIVDTEFSEQYAREVVTFRREAAKGLNSVLSFSGWDGCTDVVDFLRMAAERISDG